jgi:hypothetical protein
MEAFDIHLDQDNELNFKVMIEGTEEANLKYQLILESGNMDYCFTGQPETSGEILFVIPPLQKMLSEGTYNTRLEVIVDDRIFTPLVMHTNAKKQVKVMAEATIRRRKSTPRVSAAVVSNSSHKSKQPVPHKIKETSRQENHLKLENLSEEQVRKLASIIARKKAKSNKGK